MKVLSWIGEKIAYALYLIVAGPFLLLAWVLVKTGIYKGKP